MLRILPFSLALAFLASVAACGGSAAKPTPPAAAANTDAPAHERLTVLFEQLAAGISEAQSDCEQIANLLEGWTSGHRSSYGQLSAQAASSQLATNERLRYEDRVRTALTTVVDAAAQCGANQRTQAAFTAFDVLIDPSQ